MSVPFGFSAGDFLAVIGLVVKICQALDESTGSLAEFQDVRQELKSFRHIVDSIQKAAVDPGIISSENAALLPEVLQNCTEALDGFRSFMASYNGMKSLFKKVSWVTLGKPKLEVFRSRIHANMMLLSLIQQDIQCNALNNVRTELAQVNNNVTEEIQRTAQGLQLHVTSSLSWSYDQQPIKFQDALGRRYPVPVELCRDFESFLSFLEFSFKGSPFLPLITNRDLWLFTPGGERVAWWYLLQEADWAKFVRPGMKLGMSFKPRRIDSEFLGGFPEASSKPCDGGCNQQASNIRFVKPLPPNALYDPDTEFRYLTPPQQHQNECTEELDISEPSTSLANSNTIKCSICALETISEAAHNQHKSPTISSDQFFYHWHRHKDKQAKWITESQVEQDCIVCCETWQIDAATVFDCATRIDKTPSRASLCSLRKAALELVARNYCISCSTMLERLPV